MANLSGDSEKDEDEDFLDDQVFIPLSSQLHAMITNHNRRNSWLPLLFERASNVWWNPRFDSDILETQYMESAVPKLRIRFCYGLCYAFICTLVWALYWVSIQSVYWIPCFIISLFFSVIYFMLFICSYKDAFQKRRRLFSLLSNLVAVTFMTTSLLPFAIQSASLNQFLRPQNFIFGDISMPSLFTIYIEVLLLVYTILPLKVYFAIIFCVSYSVIFEVLSLVLLKDSETSLIFIRLLLHISVHLIAGHIMIMNEVRMRGTFMDVGQSLLVRKQYEIEKALKEKMILSVMPPKVADWLIDRAQVENISEPPIPKKLKRSKSSSWFSFKRSRLKNNLSTDKFGMSEASFHGDNFRPFNMSVMDNVSILFADIVGFTKMSSNKSAENLVGLLNDLFGRFDKLCVENGCEKINTLGDCYYAVSGCPEPRQDHAVCCVNMGLAMIKAIKQFDKDTGEDVNMRVGVHTGKVLCGIVGTMRFKFDVWSQDVAFANKMESTGKPGQVHITDATKKFLPHDFYVIQEGPVVQGSGMQEHKTFFIIGEKTASILEPPTDPALRRVSDHDEESLSLKLQQLEEKKSSSLPNIVDTLLQSASATQLGKPTNSKINLKTFKKSFYRKDIRKKDLRLTFLSAKKREKSPNLPKITAYRVNSTPDKGSPIGGFELRDILESGGSGLISCCESEPPRLSRQSSRKISPSSKNHPKTLKLSPDSKNSDKLSLLLSPSFNNYSKTLKLSPDSKRSDNLSPLISPIKGQAPLNLTPEGSQVSKRDSSTKNKSPTFSIDDFLDCELHPESLNARSPRLSTLNECEKKFLKMRKQSDLQMIKCVRTQRQSYVMLVSPLCPISLSFTDPELETQYHLEAHQPRQDELKTMASVIYNTYFDVLITSLVYFNISISLLLLFGFSVLWISLFVVFSSWHLCILFLCLYRVILFSKKGEWEERGDVRCRVSSFWRQIFGDESAVNEFFAHVVKWKRWHLCGASILIIPSVILLSHFSCSIVLEIDDSMRYFCLIASVALIHFCNFTQLSWRMKNILAMLVALIFLVFVSSPLCSCPFEESRRQFQSLNSTTFTSDRNRNLLEMVHENITSVSKGRHILNSSTIDATESRPIFKGTSINVAEGRHNFNTTFVGVARNRHIFHIELIISYLLLLVLILLLNREYEISYRLSFYGYITAIRDKMNVKNMKNQAEWLLNNIIPQHVANIIKSTAKYSRNHINAGVMFASVINFNELYNEDYSSGKEYLRFLNELIADFDELLKKPKYASIEKIKTIGSTYMAASGLDPELRKVNEDENQHVFDLVDFALDMFQVLENFNQSMIGFRFILRIGLNCGDVTAGVIGTTKLFYDIWGDAVNIASRMDSTGVANKVQVPAMCADILRPLYAVEHRGQVFVKGKDNMDVYVINVEHT